MRAPVFSFEAEVLTDAPFGHIREKMEAAGSPGSFQCLKALKVWGPAEVGQESILLRWERQVLGAREEGSLLVRPDPKGAHLRLEGRMRGWSGFLLFGLLRWRTDRLLDRLVEEL